MIPSMVAMVTIPSAASGVRQVRISVPRIDCLLDNRRYFLPGDLPAPAGEGLRPMSRPRITKAPRAPSLRTMVRMAVKCADAEQLGERLKRRYQRQLQRRGLARPGNGRDEDELDRLLGQD
jgi:hypothetical protein